MTLHAFIDEAGQRAATTKSSHHFVMSAVVIADTDLPDTAAAQAQLRADLGRRPGDTLHWANLKGHPARLHAAKTVAQMPVTISSVVVCKKHLSHAPLPSEDHAYMYAARLLIERLSWLARGRNERLTYTLAHVVRFKLSTLREYEALLRSQPNEIAWKHLDPRGGQLDQPSRREQLQLADIAASATFPAFEPDQFGNTEQRYLKELAGVLYRRPPGVLTSYGLKMHPWTASTKAAYPWVAAL